MTVAAAQGSAPGVALYVDEQPVSFGARNLDFYAVDMERVEVLSGPQGTLFGASSQSGNLRLITNKPQQGVFETGFNAKYSSTHGGADSVQSARNDGLVQDDWNEATYRGARIGFAHRWCEHLRTARTADHVYQ